MSSNRKQLLIEAIEMSIKMGYSVSVEYETDDKEKFYINNIEGMLNALKNTVIKMYDDNLEYTNKIPHWMGSHKIKSWDMNRNWAYRKVRNR